MPRRPRVLAEGIGWRSGTVDEPGLGKFMRELVVLVGVDVYGVMVSACAEYLGMNAGGVSRALARASAGELEDGAFHEQRLDLEERLATLEAAPHRPTR